MLDKDNDIKESHDTPVSEKTAVTPIWLKGKVK